MMQRMQESARGLPKNVQKREHSVRFHPGEHLEEQKDLSRKQLELSPTALGLGKARGLD
jgi:hypothetical protein